MRLQPLLSFSSAGCGTHPSCCVAEFPVQDPVHDAPCILAALRRRHAVRGRIRDGVRQQRSFQRPGGPSHLASLKHGQFASLVEVEDAERLKLCIADLESGTEVHCWLLPSRLGPYMRPRHLTFQPSPPGRLRPLSSEAWRWGGVALALPCYETIHSSLLLVTTSTGSCVLLEGAVLLSDWSRTGLLLVALGGVHSTTLGVIDATGRIIQTAALDLEVYRIRTQWSPDGSSVMLYCHYERNFWLWEVSGGDVTCHHLSQFVIAASDAACTWCPDSRRVLFVAHKSAQLLVWSPHGQHLQGTSGLVGHPAWGRHSVVALMPQAPVNPTDNSFCFDCRKVQLHTVGSDGLLAALGSVRIEPLGGSECTRTMSPDGSLVAVITQRLTVTLAPRTVISTHGVAVVSLDALWQQHFLLPFSPDHLEWAADGSALLASSYYAGQDPDYVLLGFSDSTQ